MLKRIGRVWIVSSLALVSLPAPVWADAGHPKVQAELSLGTYIFLGFGLLLALSFISYLIQRKRLREVESAKPRGQEAKERRQRLSSRVSLLRIGSLLMAAGLLITGAVNVWSSSKQAESVSLGHIHGLGYSSDGQRLLAAAHDGIKVWQNGRWSAGEGEEHDYMGFSVTDQGFYSSGHPAPGSKLKDPLGIVRSLDEGHTVEPLAHYGQIDFHLMAAGYKSHTLYVINPQPTAQLQEQGLYYSADEGRTWAKSASVGLTGEITAIAAHPDEPSTVAVGTVSGVYLSKDFGSTFEALTTGQQITGLTFGPTGGLLAGVYASNKPGLIQIDPAAKTVKELTIPPMNEDAAAYIAAHPKNVQQLAIATFLLDVYTSTDGGTSWQQVLEKGKPLE